MVVVAAVLVVVDEQGCVLPVRRVQQRVDDLGDELLADLDVLRVVLGRGVVVRVDERELGQLAGGGVGEEVADRLGARNL